jgi:hypothetical protein
MVSWVMRAVRRASAVVRPLAFVALAVSAQGFRWQA